MNNIKKKEFTFICATIDSTNDVKDFILHLDDLKKQNDQFKINLILIDQHPTSRSNELSTLSSETLYIHSKKKGLSLNRNIGIDNLQPGFFSFMDCDCRIDKNYFVEVEKNFNHKKIDFLYGKIAEIDSENDVFKKWPKKEKSINLFDKWIYSTSVNIVYQTKDIYFDELLGIGANYGSCEDVDFALRKKGVAFYSPHLITRHPAQPFASNDIKKIKSYATGFGALCKKHLSFFSIFLFSISLITPIKKLVFRQSSFAQAKASIQGKIHGFCNYRK